VSGIVENGRTASLRVYFSSLVGKDCLQIDNNEASMSEESDPRKDVIYCPNCGQQLHLDANFCDRCGNEIQNRGSREEDVSERSNAAAARRAENPRPVDHQPAETSQGTGESNQWVIGRKVTVGAAVVGAVGAFLPWITINVMASSASVRGIQGDGRITLVLCFLVFITAAWRWGAWQRGVTFILGGVTLLLGGAYINDPLWGVENPTVIQQQYSEAITPGLGLYLTAGAGLVIVLAVVYDTWFNTNR